MKTIIQIALCISSLVISIAAQEPQAQKSQIQLQSSEKQIDQLFNQIIQTIPEKNIHKSDSTEQASVAKSLVEMKSEPQQDSHIRRNQMVNELPDDIQRQVEQAIVEIQNKKEERVPKFLEHRKQE